MYEMLLQKAYMSSLGASNTLCCNFSLGKDSLAKREIPLKVIPCLMPEDMQAFSEWGGMQG